MLLQQKNGTSKTQPIHVLRKLVEAPSSSQHHNTFPERREFEATTVIITVLRESQTGMRNVTLRRTTRSWQFKLLPLSGARQVSLLWACKTGTSSNVDVLATAQQKPGKLSIPIPISTGRGIGIIKRGNQLRHQDRHSCCLYKALPFICAAKETRNKDGQEAAHTPKKIVTLKRIFCALPSALSAAGGKVTT